MIRLTEVGTGPEWERFVAVGGPGGPGPDAMALQRPEAMLLLEGPVGPIARCALWWTGTAGHGGLRVGAVGYYFAADGLAGTTMLSLACDRLVGRGCGLAVGPLDGSTWRRYRLVTDRGTEPPFFLEPDNPDDWPVHFSSAGFAPLAHYRSALTTDLGRRDARADEVEQSFKALGGVMRPLDLGRFDEEVERIHALSLASFRGNLLFAPLGLDEFRDQCAALREFVRPELVLLAERQGRLVGYIFALPDVLQPRRGCQVDTVVIKTLAVHPDHAGAGLGSLLTDRCHQVADRFGYRRAVHALMPEGSRSEQISLRTARPIRRYSLFAKPLAGETL